MRYIFIVIYLYMDNLFKIDCICVCVCVCVCVYIYTKSSGPYQCSADAGVEGRLYSRLRKTHIYIYIYIYIYI